MNMLSLVLSFRLLLGKGIDTIKNDHVFWVFSITELSTLLCSVAKQHTLTSHDITNIK